MVRVWYLPSVRLKPWLAVVRLAEDDPKSKANLAYRREEEGGEE